MADFVVTFVAGTGGTITGTATQSITEGGNCTAVTAVPNDNYSFIEWTGTGGFVTTATNPLTVSNVTGTMTITANFDNTVSIGTVTAGTATARVGRTINIVGTTTSVDSRDVYWTITTFAGSTAHHFYASKPAGIGDIDCSIQITGPGVLYLVVTATDLNNTCVFTRYVSIVSTF